MSRKLTVRTIATLGLLPVAAVACGGSEAARKLELAETTNDEEHVIIVNGAWPDREPRDDETFLYWDDVDTLTLDMTAVDRNACDGVVYADDPPLEELARVTRGDGVVVVVLDGRAASVELDDCDFIVVTGE